MTEKEKNRQRVLNGGRGGGQTDRRLFEYYENKVYTLNERIVELEAYNEKLLNGDIEKHNKIVLLEQENAELKSKNKWYSKQVCCKECAGVWGKAKEHIRTLISCLIDWVQEGDKDYCHIEQAEQFLKECE